jgi:hypothetical protein
MANTKVTALSAVTTLAAADLLPVVVDTGTTPTTKKITLSNVFGPGNAARQGTSFPASPATGRMFFRSDLGLDCYYDGARWLTINEFVSSIDSFTVLSANGNVSVGAIRTDYKPYITRYVVHTNVATTNDGTKYWTIDIRSLSATYANTTTVTTFTTASDTASTWANHESSTMTGTATPDNSGNFDINCTKTSTPGNLTYTIAVYYKLIVT